MCKHSFLSNIPVLNKQILPPGVHSQSGSHLQPGFVYWLHLQLQYGPHKESAGGRGSWDPAHSLHVPWPQQHHCVSERLVKTGNWSSASKQKSIHEPVLLYVMWMVVSFGTQTFEYLPKWVFSNSYCHQSATEPGDVSPIYIFTISSLFNYSITNPLIKSSIIIMVAFVSQNFSISCVVQCLFWRSKCWLSANPYVFLLMRATAFGPCLPICQTYRKTSPPPL